MLVKMKQTIAGRVAGHWNPAKGAEIEVEDKSGALLCARGLASPVVVLESVEVRTAPPLPPELDLTQPPDEPTPVAPRPVTPPKATRKRPPRKAAKA